MNFTVQVSGLAEIRWAVFQVSEAGAYTSAMGSFVQAKVPAGGLMPISARLLGDRDRLVVQSLDGKTEAKTDGAQPCGERS